MLNRIPAAPADDVFAERAEPHEPGQVFVSWTHHSHWENPTDLLVIDGEG